MIHRLRTTLHRKSCGEFLKGEGFPDPNPPLGGILTPGASMFPLLSPNQTPDYPPKNPHDCHVATCGGSPAHSCSSTWAGQTGAPLAPMPEAKSVGSLPALNLLYDPGAVLFGTAHYQLLLQHWTQLGWVSRIYRTGSTLVHIGCGECLIGGHRTRVFLPKSNFYKKLFTKMKYLFTKTNGPLFLSSECGYTKKILSAATCDEHEQNVVVFF